MNNDNHTINRRSFLKILTAGTGTLLLAANETGCTSVKSQDLENIFVQRGIFEPSVFLSIEPTGKILVASKHAEMGQGILMGTATLMAEELEVSLDQIEVVQAHKPEFGLQMTGGSTSTAGLFLPVRRAGAAAREMLRAAAATTWGVSVEECTAKQGAIHHAGSDSQLSYGDLVPLAVLQPVPTDPPLKSAVDFSVIGKEGQRRVDALTKSTGTALFGTDVQIDNKVCAYVLRSPVMGGRAEEVVSDAALKLPGVVDVLSFERGVAVLANKYWQTKRAAPLVQVKWRGGRVKGLNTSELAESARIHSSGPGSHKIKNVGNVDKVFEDQDTKRIELQYEYPYLSHATMEPQNCTVMMTEDRVKVWVPTQAPTMVAMAIHAYFGIPKDNIEVEMTMLGGGFGRRACIDFVLEAAQIAQLKPGVPIQVIWSREDDMTMGYYRPQGACTMVGAIDESGSILAVRSHLVSQLLFPEMGEQLDVIFPKFIPEKMRRKLAYATTGYLSNTSLMGLFEGGDLATCKYALPNYRYEFSPIHVNVPVTAWRSVAHSYSTFIMETFIDHLAATGERDPLETKRELLSAHPQYLAVLDAVVTNSDWGQPIEEGWGRGIAVSEFAKSVVAQVVEAGIVNNEIVVRHVTCAVDCGLVVNPDVVRSQIESGIIYGLSMITEKIEFIDGVVQQKNFDGFPALRMYRTPEIKSILLPSDNSPTGIGEISLPPINAGVSNAIYAATGVRLTKMPLQDAWNDHVRNSSMDTISKRGRTP